MRTLRLSTAVVLTLGPFVDATDGFTAETALSPSATNVRLYKHGATASVDISTRTWTHIENGVYTVSLLAADVDTAGTLMIVAAISGARQVVHEFNVQAATTWDALAGGSALPANMTQILGNASAATNMVFTGLTPKQITVGSGSTTTRIATDLTEAVSAFWAGRTLIFYTGALAGQAVSITGYNGSTKELTVSATTSAPVNGDTAVIV